MLNTRFISFLIVCICCGVINAQKPVELIYKQIDTTQLKMIVYKPAKFKESSKCDALVFFFGGGWTGGTINQFEPFATYYAAKGLVTVLVDYRVKSRNGTTPFESLKDAKSAMRYLKVNYKALHINPDRIVAAGGSAGGHLAAACFTNESINEATDNLKISSKPAALLLFNPVIDNSKDGYGYERVKEKWEEFSPLHNIRKGFPPTAFFLGTNDKLIPVKRAETFKYKVDSVGSRCELFLYENEEHGFFNQPKLKSNILSKTDLFLTSIGYLK
jgi:acetyl esterase